MGALVAPYTNILLVISDMRRAPARLNSYRALAGVWVL
jgi:hypothetical protein